MTGSRQRRSVLKILALVAIFSFSAEVLAQLKRVEWQDLPGRLASKRVPIEAWGVADCPKGVERLPPSRVVVQFIENTFYQWNEYDVTSPAGEAAVCIVMVHPKPGNLSTAESQVLLSASRMWTESSPRPEDAVSLPASHPSLNVPAVRLPAPRKSTKSIPGEERGASSRNRVTEPDPTTDAPGYGTLGVGGLRVHGSDDRTRVTDTTSYPWSTISYVSFKKSGSAMRGSAALISPYCALTCGHVIYDQGSSQWSTDMVISPAQRQLSEGGSVYRPYGARGAAYLRTNTTYTAGGSFEYDYGAANFNTPFNGISTFMPLMFDYTPTSNNVGGYPKAVQGESNSYAMWGSFSATLGTGGSDNRLLLYTADSSGGNSGGPVWVYPGLRRTTGTGNSPLPLRWERYRPDSAGR